jgi:hypothetical protein
MEEPADKEIVYSKNVIEFYTVANEYCLFVEKVENYTKEDIISYMLKICPLIYLKGSLLPVYEESEFEISERYITEEYWEHIFLSLKNKFGNDDNYLTIAGDDKGEIVPSPASIAENLTDIYQDMKDFIMLYQKGTHAAKENAVAECRQLFETHWGSRLVNALRALHYIVYSETSHDEYYDDEI